MIPIKIAPYADVKDKVLDVDGDKIPMNWVYSKLLPLEIKNSSKIIPLKCRDSDDITDFLQFGFLVDPDTVEGYFKSVHPDYLTMPFIAGYKTWIEDEDGELLPVHTQLTCLHVAFISKQSMLNLYHNGTGQSTTLSLAVKVDYIGIDWGIPDTLSFVTKMLNKKAQEKKEFSIITFDEKEEPQLDNFFEHPPNKEEVIETMKKLDFNRLKSLIPK